MKLIKKQTNSNQRCCREATHNHCQISNIFSRKTIQNESIKNHRKLNKIKHKIQLNHTINHSSSFRLSNFKHFYILEIEFHSQSQNYHTELHSTRNLYIAIKMINFICTLFPYIGIWQVAHRLYRQHFKSGPNTR